MPFMALRPRWPLVICGAGCVLVALHTAPSSSTGFQRPGCYPGNTFCATFESGWSPFTYLTGGRACHPVSSLGNRFQNRWFQRSGRVPAVQGRNAFRSYVDDDATCQNGRRTKATTLATTRASANPIKAYQGSDYWYRFQIRFPSGFRPMPKTSWNWVMEAKNWPDSGCCSNLSLGVVTNREDGGARSNPNGRLSLRVCGGGSSKGTVDGRDVCSERRVPSGYQRTWVTGPSVKRDHWYDVVLHVRWDYTSNGKVEWWLDGTRRYSGHSKTLYFYADKCSTGSCPSGAQPGPGQTYLHLGYYRSAASYPGQSVYYDAATAGPTRASIGG